MQLSILAVNFGYAFFGVVLMFVSYRLIDKLTPEVNFPEELKKGNVAVAIFIAAIFVSIAIIIGNSLSLPGCRRLHDFRGDRERLPSRCSLASCAHPPARRSAPARPRRPLRPRTIRSFASTPNATSASRVTGAISRHRRWQRAI